MNYPKDARKMPEQAYVGGAVLGNAQTIAAQERLPEIIEAMRALERDAQYLIEEVGAIQQKVSPIARGGDRRELAPDGPPPVQDFSAPLARQIESIRTTIVIATGILARTRGEIEL